MNRISYILILATAWLLGCKTTTVATGGEPKKRTAKFLLEKLEKNTIQYDWFTAKSKVNFKSPDENISFTAEINIRKDSIIWVAVKKLGIEGMRLRITPERVELLNHLQKEYTNRPFDFLKKEYDLPLNFSDLQSLLVGNPIGLKEELITVSIKEGRYLLQQKQDNLEAGLQLNSQSYLIEKLEANALNNDISATFGDYQEVGGQQVAFQKNLDINKGKMLLEILFTKAEINEAGKTTFNVPEHYAVKE